MNILENLQKSVLALIKKEFKLPDSQAKPISINLNIDKPKNFGDFNCNAAMVLAKNLGQPPIEIAEKIKQIIEKDKSLYEQIKSVEVVKPGFVNFHLKNKTWNQIAKELYESKQDYFKLDKTEKIKKFLVEFVSANPTGPLHLGHGRGGIIGDVLVKILNFLGHKADAEFLINDAGEQMRKLANSLKIRCQQELGQAVEFPDDGYVGEYLVEIAKNCIKHYGKKVLDEPLSFLENLAKEQILEQHKKTLDNYGINFDLWFSELRVHKDGSVEKSIEMLREKNLVYEKEGALWFKSTEFGDDKDRVVKKSDGTLTYIAADIAYHKNKFDRGFDVLIDILGQDHHGYVTRLKATMEALGYNPENFDVILYQLVSLKQGGQRVKMSKRAGTFEELSEVIEKVGTDVARFFYLNRKVEAHLDFDLDIATKKTEENPVYYIQYGYVRTNSIFEKAKEYDELKDFEKAHLGDDPNNKEIEILKKICSLKHLLKVISENYQTHLLAYYTLELSKIFHNYYASNKIIDTENIEISKNRLFLTKLIQQTLGTCLDLLGLSKPERM